jgi:hypothetical protein
MITNSNIIFHEVEKFGPYVFGGFFVYSSKKNPEGLLFPQTPKGLKCFMGGIIYTNEWGVQVWESMTLEEIGQFCGGN